MRQLPVKTVDILSLKNLVDHHIAPVPQSILAIRNHDFLNDEAAVQLITQGKKRFAQF